MTQQKQEIMNASNRKENKSKIPHEHNAGDEVPLEKPSINGKMSSPRKGPHETLRVFTNGTVLLDRGAFQHEVNMRRISPHFGETNVS